MLLALLGAMHLEGWGFAAGKETCRNQCIILPKELMGPCII